MRKMRQLTHESIRFVAVLAAAGALLHSTAGAQNLTTITGEQGVHGMPLPGKAKAMAESNALQASGTPALLYNGGPVMITATTYAIFWAPTTLQNGKSTSLSASYQNIQTAFSQAYSGHGISNNNTQYYMTTGSGTSQIKSYVKNVGTFGGSYLDTSAYPSSGCSDSVTPGNCLSDTQI